MKCSRTRDSTTGRSPAVRASSSAACSAASATSSARRTRGAPGGATAPAGGAPRPPGPAGRSRPARGSRGGRPGPPPRTPVRRPPPPPPPWRPRRPQGLPCRRGHGTGQPEHDGDLEHGPYLGQLRQLARRARQDAEAPVREAFHRPLQGQLLHRLAHGGRGDAEAVAQRRTRVDLARHQLTVDQRRAQRVEDLSAHRMAQHFPRLSRYPGSGRVVHSVLLGMSACPEDTA